MADEDNIVSNVTIEGVDQADAQLKKLGDTGSETFTKIGASATAAVGPMGAVEAMAKRLGVSVEEAQKRIAANGDSFKQGAAGATELNQRLDEFEAGAKNAGGAALGLDINFKQLAGTMRVLGRATRIPGLSQLSGQMRVLGRLGALAAPFLLITALEQLASSAAHAASAVADLALKAGLTSGEFKEVAQFGAGAGVSVEKMGEAVKGVNDLFKEAASNAEKNAEKISQLKDTARQLEAQSTQLSQRYKELEKSGVKSFEKQAEAAVKFGREQRGLDDDFTQLQRDRDKFNGKEESEAEKRAHAKEELDKRELALSEKQFDMLDKRRKEERDFAQEQEKRAQQQAQLIDQEAENTKKQQENRKALSDARSEAARSGNAIERLGLSALDANGKVRKFNEEGLRDLADAFSRVPEGAEKTRIASELVAAGLDRALLPALKRGREGVDEFIAEGKKIAPGFTDAQEAIGDKFVESVNKFTLAAKNLKDQAGIELAPGFTKFFDDMRTRITDSIPFVQELSKAFGFLIGLTGKLSLQPSPIIAAIQLIKGAVTELNLGWKTIPQIAKFEFELLKSIVSGVWSFIKDAFKAGVEFIKSIPFGDILAGAWDLIKQGASAVWVFVKQKFFEGIQALKDLIPADPLGAVWNLIKQGAAAVWVFIKQKFFEGVTFLKSLIPDDPLNALWELIKQGAAAVWVFVKQKFAEGVQALKDLIPADPLGAVWDLIKQGAQLLWDFLVQKFKEGVTALQELLPEDPLAAAWELIKAGAEKVWEFIKQKFKEGAEAAWQFVKDSASSALSSIGQSIDSFMQNKLGALWTLIKKIGSAFSSLLSGGDAAVADVPAMARGGRVRGKGTSLSDSILAFLSNDEFVVRAAAVKKYGIGLLNAINSMSFPRDGFSLGGLANGGNVRSQSRGLIPAFASGGLVSRPSGGRPLVLKIGDESFSLRTRDEKTAEQITRYAIRRQVRSNGRKSGAWG